MKTLITILLITSSLQCMGQVRDTLITYRDSANCETIMDSIFWVSKPIDSLRTIRFAEAVRTPFKYQYNTIDLITMYANECYNDSVLVRKHNSHGEMCIIDWECIIERHWSNVWVHTKPTFEGFIKWIESK